MVRAVAVPDAILMTSTAAATALLFLSGDPADLGWGGIFCLTPWIGRAAVSFAAGEPALPVRFASLGSTTWWKAADIGIMLLWSVLVTVTCTAFALAAAVMVLGGPGSDLQTVAPFGIVAAAMLRVGVPLVLVGAGSCKAVMASARGH